MFLGTTTRPGRFAESGFTLIELVIVFAIVAVLTALAVPGFGKILGNSRVRSVAEALQNGLRQAQAEAIRRNRQVKFVLTNSTPAKDATAVSSGTSAMYWYIQALPIVASETVDSPYVAGGAFGSLTSGAAIAGTPVICFNSVGRLVTNGTLCTAPTSSTPSAYDVTNTGKADRRLRVTVNLAGQIRMCDPDKTLSTTSPDGC